VKRIETLFVLAGLGLFAVVVSKIGWGAALHELRTVWIALPLLVGLGVVRILTQTQAWKMALREEGVEASFGELVGIRMASQSMGYLSVLGPAISEPMKIKLLRKNWKNSTTATVVDSGVYWFSSTLVGIIGCGAAAIVLVQGGHGAALFATTTLFLLLAGLLFRQKPLLASVVEACGLRAPSWLKKGAELEEQIRTFRERHPATLRFMFRMDLICQGLLILEAALVISCAKLPVHILTVLGIEAAVRVTKIATGWIPARLGADEGGAVAAFAAFGLSPTAGLILALARRSRDLLWCLFGLGWLAWRWHRARKEAIPMEVVQHAGSHSYSAQ
jgi:Lysylphosphatidylglycerol synthase TM region